MQRTAICLVAVLALLAGCSGGVGGGSDATQTPTPEVSQSNTETPDSGPEPTPTPVPETNETRNDAVDPATTRLDATGVNETDILEGDMVRFNATVSNLNDTVANQTLTVQVGSMIVLNDTIELRPKETRTVNLLSLNTSVVEPGEKFVTISTENDSELLRIDIRPRDELETFIANVRDRTVAYEDAAILSRDHVRLYFDAERDLTEYYYSDRYEPVPQAAAFEMATSNYAPEAVTLRILPHDRTEGEVPYKTTLNRSLATKLHNGTVDPKEFEAALHQRATGEAVDHYEPDWVDMLTYGWAHEQFTFFAGDRARRAYADELAERLNATQYNVTTVDNYSLYDEELPLPDTTRELGPNDAIQVTFRADNWSEQAQYRNFSSTRAGIVGYETLGIYGNLTEAGIYGERPAFLRVRYVWPNGDLRTVEYHPTDIAREAASHQTVIQTSLEIVFSELTKEYDYRHGR